MMNGYANFNGKRPAVKGPAKNQLQGQNVQARILGPHADENQEELKNIITVGNIRLSK